MRLNELDYVLPESLIAQRPLEQRDASKLLTLDARTGGYLDHRFADLPQLLRGDELIVLNNTRVIPARLFGRRLGTRSQPPSRGTRREHLTGTVEVLLTREIEPDLWEALVHPGRKMHIGEKVLFGDGEFQAEVVARGEFGVRILRLTSRDEHRVKQHIERLGHIPLPPYIARGDEPADRERYQTVFAQNAGAVAAPTAGLHFTQEVLQAIRARGIEICELTLHVSLGTFQPIHAETLEGHTMYPETYEIPEPAADSINAAYTARRPILAVGTTVVRALEDAAMQAASSGAIELVRPGKAEARIFIYPGFQFRVVNTLLTNFHLPRSTLLALVCAFAGRDHVLRAYKHAVDASYRFYSYGDCMLVRKD